MTPDLHALISQMAAELDHCQQLLRDDRRQRHPLADRARALLAQPVAEGPSASDVTELFYRHMGEGSEVGFENAIAEALSRWGRPTPQPVAVSERLPGPEDCNEQGRCWLGGRQMDSGTPTWILGYPAWAERFPDVHRFWLPANALPTPEAND